VFHPAEAETLQDDTVVPWIVDRAMVALVLAVGGWLIYALVQVHPDPRGFGTHEQLGMLRCSWPAMSGIPCPTCGVTTAATHMLHLQPWQSVVAQPFGAALTLFCLWMWLVAGWCLLRNAPFVVRLARLPYGTILVGFTALLLGSWFYKYLVFQP